MLVAMSFEPDKIAPDFIKEVETFQEGMEVIRSKYGQDAVMPDKEVSFLNGYSVNAGNKNFARWCLVDEITPSQDYWDAYHESEAPDKIVVELQEQDLAQGEKNSDFDCPIGKRLQALGYAPSVGGRVVIVNGRLYCHTEESARFIGEFDDFLRPDPITFTLVAAGE